MQWTPRGAHLLLQTRTKVLNEDLEETFRGWYPAFLHDAEGLAPHDRLAPGNLRSP